MSNDDFDEDEDGEVFAELIEQICPLMHGKGFIVQGGVLAELTSRWLAGFEPEVREAMADFLANATQRLVNEIEKQRKERQ